MIPDAPENQPDEIDGHEPPFFTVTAGTALYKGLPGRPNLDVYLGTFNGPKRVGAVGADFTIYCPDDNGGNGRAYAGHAETTLYLIPTE